MNFKRIFLLALCGVGLQAVAQEDRLADIKKGQPIDVVEMIDRYADCNHWNGEEPYNEERRKEINSVIAELHCDSLERDEKIMLKRYRKNRLVLKALESAKGFSY